MMEEKNVHFSALKPTRFPLNGIGVEWDEMLDTPNCRSPHLAEKDYADKSDFELVCRRAKLLGIRYVRFFYDNALTEPEKGKFTHDVLQSRLQMLDFCEANGISVCVVMVSPICYDESGKRAEGCNARDYVENVLENLDYLLNRRGYTCIRELTPFNEPSFMAKAGSCSVACYTEICRLLDIETKEKGFRDRIRLNLCDTSGIDGLKLYFRAVGGMGDLYNNHNYTCARSDTDDMLMALPKFGVAFTDRLNAPYVINEFGWQNGTDTYGTDGIDTMLRGLFLPRIVIQTLNAGAVGISYWCYYDTYYSPAKEHKMLCGLFCYKDENWRCRPMYYSYGLVMNYADPGAKIFPLKSDTEGVVAVHLHNPDGSHTYFALNYTKTPAVLLLPADENLTYRRFVFREDTLPEDDRMIASDAVISAKDGVLEDTLSPMSFVVYSTKQEVAYQ